MEGVLLTANGLMLVETMEPYWRPCEAAKDPDIASYLKIVAAMPLWNKCKLIWIAEWSETVSKKSWQVVTV